METYERGGHAYHATPPTDSLVKLCKVMKEMEVFGYDRAREAQVDMGTKVRSLLYSKGFPSVAAAGFEASGVIVCYTDDPEVQSGLKFSKLGLQIAPGVPIQCDEGAEFRTFRIGLFGLEKLRNVERTVSTFQRALDSIVQ
jgi:aspartate aminotransferase-like enzyme